MALHSLKTLGAKRCYWLLLYYCASVVVIMNIMLLLQYDQIASDKGIQMSYNIQLNIRNNATPKYQESTFNSSKGNVSQINGTDVTKVPKMKTLKPGVLPRVPNKKVYPKVESKGLNATELQKLEKEYYRRRPVKVSPFNHTIIMEEKNLCSPDMFLVILIHSAPQNTEKRQAIRDTWGKAARDGYWPNKNITDKISLGFVIGIPQKKTYQESLTNESQLHRDIIQGDFIDDYKNMTLKSLLDLQWVQKFCPQARYFLKSDDDMVINLPYLLSILHKKPLKRSVMGPLCEGSPVHRKGIWGVDKALFPFSKYPPYEAGSAYIITVDVVKELYETAEYVPRFHIDDAYITGVLGKIIGVYHARVPGFSYENTKIPKACDILTNRVITGHRMKPLSLYQMWRELEDGPVCQIKKPTVKSSSHLLKKG